MSEEEDIIRAYVTEAMSTASELRLAFGTQDLLAAVLGGKIQRRGRVGELEYDFHGYGCRVVGVGGRAIDFEFGAGGEAGGFDAWRIWMYAKERGTENVTSLQQIEVRISSMEAEGTVYRKKSDRVSPGLYYLK